MARWVRIWAGRSAAIAVSSPSAAAPPSMSLVNVRQAPSPSAAPERQDAIVELDDPLLVRALALGDLVLGGAPLWRALGRPRILPN